MTRNIHEYGLTLNAKHSYDDFGLMLSKKPVLTTPQPRRVVKSVPYRNGNYDASYIFGKQFYDTRTLTCAWEIVDDDTVAMERKKTAFVTWLLGAHAGSSIKCDDYPNFTMTGAVSSITDSYDEEDNFLTVEATFEVQPYRTYSQTVQFGQESVTFDVEIACTGLLYSWGGTGTEGDLGTVVVDGVTYQVDEDAARASLELAAGTHTATGKTSGRTNSIVISTSSL